MKLKSIVIGIIIGVMLTSSIGVFAEGLTVLLNPFPIMFNGVLVDAEAYNVNGRTCLALGDMMKLIGGTAKLNETTKIIEVTTNESEVPNMSLTETLSNTKYTPDGIEAHLYTNEISGVQQYVIPIGAFTAKYTDSGYKRVSGSIEGTYAILKDDKVIIDNIHFVEKTFMFDYDYYVNTILPLLK